MSIQEKLGKFKPREDLFVAVLLVLVAGASFGLGRLSVEPEASPKLEKVAGEAKALGAIVDPTEEVIVPPLEVEEAGSDNIQTAIEGGYVASKSGTKYHLPWCAGAKQISEKNKIWFQSKEEAEAAGYTPAANCKGI